MLQARFCVPARVMMSVAAKEQNQQSVCITHLTPSQVEVDAVPMNVSTKYFLHFQKKFFVDFIKSEMSIVLYNSFDV